MFQKSNTVKQTYVRELWLTVTVCDQHKVKTSKSNLTCSITLGIAPHPHGNPVRCDPVPVVLP